MKSHSALLQKHMTSLAVKLVQSYSFRLSSSPQYIHVSLCQWMSRSVRGGGKRDSASYLEEVGLKHECGCHGSAVAWTAGVWKFASGSGEKFKQSRHQNKQGWQRTTVTPILGEMHSGRCQLHTEARCYFSHHKHTAYNDVYLRCSKPCLGTYSFILAAIDPAGKRTE